MSKHSEGKGLAGKLGIAALALALCHCAEAKFEQIASPDAPVPPPLPDAASDSPSEDAPLVPDAPSLDAPVDATPDGGIVDAPGDAQGDGGLPDAPDAPPPPPADVCATADEITAAAKLAGGYAAQATTLGFYNDTYDGCGFGSYGGLDRVYRFDLTAGDILTVLVTPIDGSTVDLALSLLTGCGGGEMCVNSADSGFTGDPESMVWIAGTTATYYLYVDAYYANTGGPFSLNVIISTPPPL